MRFSLITSMKCNLAIVVAALLITSSSLADEIRLKGSVRLQAHAKVVLLSDIAVLTGDIAHKYADTVIADAPKDGRVLELSISAVRRVLSDADAHWGKLQLIGRRVLVRPRFAEATPPPQAMMPTSIVKTTKYKPQVKAVNKQRIYESAAELVKERTLRGSIAEFLAKGLKIAPSKLRLNFSANDASMLEASTNAFRFEIQPRSNLQSDRVELSVIFWSNNSVNQTHSLSVHPSVSIDAVKVTQDIKRGETLTEVELTSEQQWVSAGAAIHIPSLIEAVGRIATSKIKEGTTLKRQQIRRQFVVKRGDRVIVKCIVGGVVITLEAEAKSDGAIGDDIEFKKIGERETFIATVSGSRAAVLNLRNKAL